MRIHTIRIPSTNMGESEKFYALLLESEKAFGSSDHGYVGFVLENVSILLEPAEEGEFEAGRYLGFSFEVANIVEFYERLNSKIQFTGPPEKQLWGGIMTHVSDSSGNILSIVEMTPDA